jgi:hypothetical protein
MEYLVVAADGSVLGPFDVPSLIAFKREGKILPETLLRDFSSGREIQARYLPDLFPMAVPPVIAAEYGAQTSSPYPRGEELEKPVNPGPTFEAVVRAFVMRSALAVIVGFIVFPAGVILAIYNVFVAFQLRKNKSEHAEVAMKVALSAFAFLAIYWSLQQNGIFG